MVGRKTGDSILIIWNAEDSTECGSVAYDVELTLTDNERQIIKDNTMNAYYRFTELSPNTPYTATVCGSNEAGKGDKASLRIETLNQIIPSIGMFSSVQTC